MKKHRGFKYLTIFVLTFSLILGVFRESQPVHAMQSKEKGIAQGLALSKSEDWNNSQPQSGQAYEIRNQEKISFLKEAFPVRHTIPDLESDTLGMTEPQAFTSCAGVTDVPVTECEALVELYNTTGGTSWTQNSGWLATNQVCSWAGIGCASGQVSQIYLYNNNLVGNLTVDFSGFSGVWYFDLGANQLTGDMGTIITNIPVGLQNLYLDQNNFTGTIPEEISNLYNLKYWSLGENQLTGDLSTIIGYLPLEIKELYLYENDFTGTIPETITDLRDLRYINVSGNQLSGDLETIVGYLHPYTRQLGIGSNNITGTIPYNVYYRLYYAEYLDFGDNQLTGPVPTAFAGLSYLEVLAIGGNQLTGELSAILDHMPNSLIFLDMYGNLYSGAIPFTISNLTNLEVLDISSNTALRGTVPISITNLPLIWFNFSNTNLCELQKPAYVTWKASVPYYYPGLCSSASINMMTNDSFETFIPVGWQDGRQVDPDDGPDCGTSHAHTGNCALHFEGDGTSKRIFMRYKLAGLAGDSFELSLWRGGLNVPAADGAYVKATLFYKDGAQESFKLNLDKGNWSIWEQYSIAFSAAKDYKRINLDLFYKKASGIMWLDDISLTRNQGGELLENTSFETYKPDDYMRSAALTPSDGPACGGIAAYTDNCSVLFSGDGNNKRLLQRVRKAGNAGDPFTISIFRKGESVPAAGGAFVKVEIFYTDGTSDIIRLDLDTGDLNVWELFGADCIAAKDYKRFNIDLFYKKNSGMLWLDEIILVGP